MIKENENKAKQSAKDLLGDDILTVKEVSAILKISASSIYELAQQGKIRAVKFGRHWRFLAGDIRDYLLGVKNIARVKDPLEKRLHPRIDSEISACLISGLSNSKTVPQNGAIHNLSESGAYFVTANTGGENPGREAVLLRPGNPAELMFEIQERHGVAMKIKGRVVRVLNHGHAGYGIKFRYLTKEHQEIIREYVG